MLKKLLVVSFSVVAVGACLVWYLRVLVDRPTLNPFYYYYELENVSNAVEGRVLCGYADMFRSDHQRLPRDIDELMAYVRDKWDLSDQRWSEFADLVSTNFYFYSEDGHYFVLYVGDKDTVGTNTAIFIDGRFYEHPLACLRGELGSKEGCYRTRCDFS